MKDILGRDIQEGDLLLEIWTQSQGWYALHIAFKGFSPQYVRTLRMADWTNSRDALFHSKSRAKPKALLIITREEAEVWAEHRYSTYRDGDLLDDVMYKLPKVLEISEKIKEGEDVSELFDMEFGCLKLKDGVTLEQ